ncbi:hypothetical protein GCM10025867_18280 [Frondihabitans sucicola]|uniref:Bacterial Pleckstrin homology domain-containing protein n=1 Tax=Frondihabitans sucicola TaxID=1268041 RepID=A0ABM8GME2_9MICO|nr:hypothetical protein [Frondihabitans sucicola]BDZ49587.1 hypothetical protein GCM10025867_18280 [Frondihabitans sucicola]
MAAAPDAWQTTVTSRVLSVTSVVLAAAAAVVLAYWLAVGQNVDLLVVVIALIVVAAFSASCARVRVTVGSTGVVVDSVVLGFPLAQFALDDIADAWVDLVSVGSWYGWGYRATLGASGVILQRGPGLVLSLVSGKEFTVTLPSAGAALAALEAAADARGV